MNTERERERKRVCGCIVLFFQDLSLMEWLGVLRYHRHCLRYNKLVFTIYVTPSLIRHTVSIDVKYHERRSVYITRRLGGVKVKALLSGRFGVLRHFQRATVVSHCVGQEHTTQVRVRFGLAFSSSVVSVQFNSVEDDIYALGKAHKNYALHPSLRSFPKVAFENMLCPIYGHCSLTTLPFLINKRLKRFPLLFVLMQDHSRGDSAGLPSSLPVTRQLLTSSPASS